MRLGSVLVELDRTLQVFDVELKGHDGVQHFVGVVLGQTAPLIGVGLSVWLLDEPLHSVFVWGAVMVMAGMILVNLAPQTRRLNGA